jgi:hypothetical protein
METESDYFPGKIFQVSSPLHSGRKDDHGKERFDLIPPYALLELARVYTMGASKYEDRNWEKGMKWGRVFAAIMRHLWQWWGGLRIDHESGLSHLSHAAWGCFALLEYDRRGIGEDDRSKSLHLQRSGKALGSLPSNDNKMGCQGAFKACPIRE